MDPHELRAAIQEEIGLDIYAPYKTEKYLLPPEVWQIFFEVLVIEFLKGFFDFETLGKGLRAKVNAFVSSYREDPKLLRLGLSSQVNEALENATLPGKVEIEEAQQRVTAFLIAYGIDKQSAAEHSLAITQQITQALAR
jgi:hypothetical protein